MLDSEWNWLERDRRSTISDRARPVRIDIGFRPAWTFRDSWQNTGIVQCSRWNSTGLTWSERADPVVTGVEAVRAEGSGVSGSSGATLITPSPVAPPWESRRCQVERERSRRRAVLDPVDERRQEVRAGEPRSPPASSGMRGNHVEAREGLARLVSAGILTTDL